MVTLRQLVGALVSRSSSWTVVLSLGIETFDHEIYSCFCPTRKTSKLLPEQDWPLELLLEELGKKYSKERGSLSFDSCYSKCGLRASSITSPGDLLEMLTPKLHSEQAKSRSSACVSQDGDITGITCFASGSLADLQAPFRFERHWSSRVVLQSLQMPWLRGHLGST